MNTKRPLAVIFLTVLVDLIGIGILIPVIPQILANPESPSYILSGQITHRQGLLLYGLLTAVYPLMSFLSAPILGAAMAVHLIHLRNRDHP